MEWGLILIGGITSLTLWAVCRLTIAQNRYADTLHGKLDKLLHAVQGAQSAVLDAENTIEQELRNLKKQYGRDGRSKE